MQCGQAHAAGHYFKGTGSPPYLQEWKEMLLKNRSTKEKELIQFVGGPKVKIHLRAIFRITEKIWFRYLLKRQNWKAKVGTLNFII